MLSSRWRQSKPFKTIRKRRPGGRRIVRPFDRYKRSLLSQKKHVGEIKDVDTQFGFSVSTTAFLAALNLVAVGANEHNRVGRRIEMQYVKITAALTPYGGAHDFPQVDYYRISIVYDRQPNGALPAYADIFQSVDNAGTTTTNAFSEVNVDNKYRFVILSTDKYNVQPADGNAHVWGAPTSGGNYPLAGDMTQSLKYEKFLPLKGLITQFQGDSAAIASIATGSLLITAIAQNNTSSSVAVEVQGNCRVAYFDA